jgi:hypothetical protein
MGLMDKMKQQAEQALGKAQQGMSQGQAKLDQVQSKRQADVVLRNLGVAYYAQQRQGGTDEAVTTALAAVDEHVSAHGPFEPTPGSDPTLGSGPTAGLGDFGDDSDAPQPGPYMAPPTPPPPVATGNFNPGQP